MFDEDRMSTLKAVLRAENKRGGMQHGGVLRGRLSTHLSDKPPYQAGRITSELPVIRAGPAACCQIEAAVRSRAEALSARLAPLSQRVSRISSAHAVPP